MAYNILIVDDSLPMRAVVKKSIKISGFNAGQFLSASNGKEALDILRDNWCDLVVADYNMPSMNGMELIVAMRKDETLNTIPVVMVTTEGSALRVKEFMEAGAAGYIKKPFTPEQIRQQLNNILGEPENGEENSDNGDEDFDF